MPAAAIELPGGQTPDAPPPLTDQELARRDAVRPFIERSRDRWKTADQSSSTFRAKMREDQLFASGGGHQWTEEERQNRNDDARPCLEINRIPQFIRQVSNQARASRSQIQYTPRSGGATQELASVLTGLARAIETESDADIAYDTAVEHQLRSGMGFVRLRSAWANDTGFETVCRIERLRNPLAVYWDPSVQDATFADARYMHIVALLGKDEYDARWGKTRSYNSLTEFRTGRVADDWLPEGQVVVTEYFYVEVEPKPLLQLANGVTVWAEDLQDYLVAWQMANPPGAPMPPVIRQRSVDTRVVRWCLHNAVDILEGDETRTKGRVLPGTRIPIFPVIGDEIDCDGEVDYRGMVRDAKDPQRLYNYWTSTIAESIALTPKSPWLAEAEQVASYFDDWKEANRKTQSVLLYNAKTVDGQLVPAPIRNVAEPPIQAMVLGLKESDQDLKSVMGLFEASLGSPGPQQSGKAISAVQQQGLLANSNFIDNQQRTKRALGRALLDWIRVVYDTPRLVHVLDPANKSQAVMVHAGQQNAPPSPPPDVTKVFDISVGTYDVTIATGPSFQTERQRAEANLLELFKVLPGLGQIGADILLEHSDNPAAVALSKRAKLMLPPQVQAADDPTLALPKLLAQNQQMQMVIQKAQQAIQKMAQTLEKEELSASAKIQVAMIQADAAMAVAASKSQDTRALAAFQAEYDRVSQHVEHLSTLAQAEAEHEQQLIQQAQQAMLGAPGAAPGGPPAPGA